MQYKGVFEQATAYIHLDRGHRVAIVDTFLFDYASSRLD